MTPVTLTSVVVVGAVMALGIALGRLGRNPDRQLRAGVVAGLVLAFFASCELLRGLYVVAALAVRGYGNGGGAWLLAGAAVALVGILGRSLAGWVSTRLGFGDGGGRGLSIGLICAGAAGCLLGLGMVLGPLLQ